MKDIGIRLSLLLVLPLTLLLVLILQGTGFEQKGAAAVIDGANIAIADKTPGNATTASAVKVKPVDQIKKSKPIGKVTYLVKVDLKEQQMSVWQMKGEISKTIRTMPCATGKKHTPTPKGAFQMKPVGKFLYDGKYHCYLKYVIRFNGSYLIHSVPVSATGKVLDWTMGKPASHGCIRLGIEDAKWLYQLTAAKKLLIE